MKWLKKIQWRSFKDLVLLPLKEMREKKLRAVLTLVGIVIGISAVVSLITLGQGLENAIDEQFSLLGKDKLFISPRGSGISAGASLGAVTLTQDDLETVRATSGVEIATGLIYSSAGIEFNDNIRYFVITGMSSDPDERLLAGEASSFNIDKGRTISKNDKFKVVLGHDYSKPDLLGREINPGDKVLIQGQEFKVIGLWEKIGNPTDDRSMIIPIDTYWELFPDEDEEYGILIAQAQAGVDVNVLGARLEKELRDDRGLDEGDEDLEIQTPDQFADSFGDILNIVQLVVIGIAAISLVVGGVGIMNTMYTSVLERTKQVGVMKALGARNEQILVLFLFEAGFYGFIGGIIGVICGIGFAKFVEFILAQGGGTSFLLIKIDPYVVIFALLFSFVVGCLSGIAPARRAAKMDPVDALRYE